MCQFFSFVGDGFGNYLYSDWVVREKLLKEKYNDSPDSHTWILTNNNIPSDKQDSWSTYEYNPLTKQFTVDQGVEGHDHESAEAWVNAISFKTVVPQLIIKLIVNPLAKSHKGAVTKKDIELLKQWASEWDSGWASVWASVRASVGASVWASVRASVGASVWDSVWASVWASVGVSVWAYITSFFDIPYKYDFTTCIELYNRNLVPSFDGTTWRLHTGKSAKIVWEGKL